MAIHARASPASRGEHLPSRSPHDQFTHLQTADQRTGTAGASRLPRPTAEIAPDLPSPNAVLSVRSRIHPEESRPRNIFTEDAEVRRRPTAVPLPAAAAQDTDTSLSLPPPPRTITAPPPRLQLPVGGAVSKKALVDSDVIPPRSAREVLAPSSARAQSAGRGGRKLSNYAQVSPGVEICINFYLYLREFCCSHKGLPIFLMYRSRMQSTVFVWRAPILTQSESKCSRFLTTSGSPNR